MRNFGSILSQVPVELFATFSLNGERNIYRRFRSFLMLTSGTLLLATAAVAQAPSPVSVSPSSGSALNQTFTAVFNDPVSANNITVGEIFIMNNGVVPGTPGSGPNECVMKYDRASNGFSLVNDSGNAWQSPTSMGGGGVVSNSQCTVSGSSSISASGATLTVNFSVQFNGGTFSGAKQIYMIAANSSGWSSNYQTVFGTWTVPTQPPVPNPTSFAIGIGTISATFNDVNGGTDVAEAVVDIMTSPSDVPKIPGLTSSWSPNNCLMKYEPSTNNIYIVPDAGGSWSTPIVAGSSASVSNSQCSVYASGSSKAISGNTLSVTLRVSFNLVSTNYNSTFAVYLQGENNSGHWSTNYQNQFGTLFPDLDNSQPPNPTHDAGLGWGYCAGPALGDNCDSTPTTFSLNSSQGALFSDGFGLNGYVAGPAQAPDQGDWGILWFYKTPLTSGHNYTVGWRWQVDDSTYLQAAEFDFPVEDSNNLYYFGSQCDLGNTGVWQFWYAGSTPLQNPNAPGVTINTMWNDIYTVQGQTIPCSIAPNTWYTLVWTGSQNGSQMTYTSVQINGVSYAINLSIPSVPIPPSGGPVGPNHIAVQFQQDGHPANQISGGYHMYVDNMTALAQ